MVVGLIVTDNSVAPTKTRECSNGYVNVLLQKWAEGAFPDAIVLLLLLT